MVAARKSCQLLRDKADKAVMGAHVLSFPPEHK